MRWLKLGLLAIVSLLVIIATPPAIASYSPLTLSPSTATSSIHLSDRTLYVGTPSETQLASSPLIQIVVDVTVKNLGTRAFLVQPADFSLSAEGDMFGQASMPSGTPSQTAIVRPGDSIIFHVTFPVPVAVLPRASLVYHPRKERLVASIRLPTPVTTPPPTRLAPVKVSTDVPESAPESGQLATDTTDVTTTNSSATPLATGTVTPKVAPPPTAPTSTASVTPTSTPTTISTSTPTPIPLGTINEFSLNGGVGDPWGTAIDPAGNVWFAEPGCDFSPTCPSTSGPGELGELLAGSNTLRWYTLPNISGNQPIFVTLDNLGNVWFTSPNNSMIGEFSPVTQSFVGEWPVTPNSGPWDLTYANGKIWYTEHFVSAVGEFDPTTHTYQDFVTPSAASNPYGIAATGTLIWFAENNSSVARIAKLDTANNNQISEYLIRPSPSSSLTPHLLAADANGNLWWSEGFVRAIGRLDPRVATPGVCGTTTGDCVGVSEFGLPPTPPSCSNSHVSGIAVEGGGSLIWVDDSLSAQVGNYNPSTNQFALESLASCGAHPHDGLNLDAALPPHVWWDEEFANALGRLTQKKRLRT